METIVVSESAYDDIKMLLEWVEMCNRMPSRLGLELSDDQYSSIIEHVNEITGLDVVIGFCKSDSGSSQIKLHCFDEDKEYYLLLVKK